MTLIDTHSHIYAEEFDPDIQQVIQRALEVGVDKIFLPNIDMPSVAPMMQLVDQFPSVCFPMMGLHPTSVNENYLNDLSEMEKLLTQKRFYAIGEVGIDLYWDKTFLTQQQDAFDRQIQWSLKHQLPLIIHSRDSYDEIFQVLEQYKNRKLRGIFHCFSGTLEQAHRITQMGFLLGVGGVLTFKNAGLDKIYDKIPVEHLVLETDAPYLAPTPKRGKRNESAYLPYIAQKLAQIQGITPERVAEITTTNASQLFGI